MTGRLSAVRLPDLPTAARPRPRRSGPPGIVHIGLGAFHRAHQAVHTERAGDWGILAVSPRSTQVVEALRPQDGYYSVVEDDGAHRTTRVIGSIVDTANLVSEPEKVLDAIAAPSTRVVTLTVTEKGYRLDPRTGELLVDDELRAEAAGGPPRTAIGALVRGLSRRVAADAGPIALASCDNLPDNGAALRSAVRGFCELMPAGQARPVLEFLDEAVGFPSSVVDRIVPATREDDLAQVAAELGARDHAAVATEPYSQWVTTDDFPGGRPDWQDAGVVFTGDTRPYELAKLRVLNASHSAFAYLGGLAGYETIAETVRDETFARLVRGMLAQDVLPTLHIGPEIDAAEYADTVLRRFTNPTLRHRTAQVGADGSLKLPVRLLGVARERLAAGVPPRRIALVVAAWLRCTALGVNDQGQPIEVSDPLAARLRELAGNSPAAHVRRLLAELDPELAENAEFTGLVGEHLHGLASCGAQVFSAAELGEGRT